MMQRYNITNSTDFQAFVNRVAEATQLKKKLDWNVINGCWFAFSALTTVGKHYSVTAVVLDALTYP
jgi:hypothetical protein